MLIGRDSELTQLEQWYNTESSSLVLLHAPILFGKTTLIHEFCKNKPVFYYTFFELPAEYQLNSLFQSLLSFLIKQYPNDYAMHSNRDVPSTFIDWNRILSLLVPIQSIKKLVFVIDDFEKLSKDYFFYLYQIINLWNNKIGYMNIMLIITLSDSFRIQEDFSNNPELYNSHIEGSIIHSFKLQPLSFYTVLSHLDFFGIDPLDAYCAFQRPALRS